MTTIYCAQEDDWDGIQDQRFFFKLHECKKFIREQNKEAGLEKYRPVEIVVK